LFLGLEAEYLHVLTEPHRISKLLETTAHWAITNKDKDDIIPLSCHDSGTFDDVIGIFLRTKAANVYNHFPILQTKF
jgi:hypothetical protein